MSQEERHDERDRIYSAWHRRLSTGRFVGLENAQLLAMIDIDAVPWLEIDDKTKEPLALFETARDVGQAWKASTATARLADKAQIPCYVVLYTPSEDPNPADKQWPDIRSFRVRRILPRPETEWITYTPREWAQNLLRLRDWQARKVAKVAMR